MMTDVRETDRRSRLTATLTALVVCAASACGGSDDTTVAVTTTVLASVLAPSQVSAATVPPPTAPARCDPALVSSRVVAGDGGVGAPDQVVELRNEGDHECDVDISATENAVAEMEPSVRLEPGEVGVAWVVAANACDSSPAEELVDELVLDVNGERRVVELLEPSPCGVEVIAFFTE